MTVHVVGAGIAGLACAVTVALSGRGRPVIVYDTAGQAGGRCRSFHDARLDRTIDNGTHLIIGANTAALAYIDRIGAREQFAVTRPARFPFLDLATGETWTLRPGRGRVPWWLLVPGRRVAGSRLADYLPVRRLLAVTPGGGATVADCLTGPLMERLWRPLTEAALNTTPEEASAALFARVVADSLMQGEEACRPHLARDGLSAALVEPALRRLAEAGGVVRLGARLRAVVPLPGGAGRDGLRLHFDSITVDVGPGEAVVLALPPWAVADLLPETAAAVPTVFRSIVNVHFRLSAGARADDVRLSAGARADDVRLSAGAPADGWPPVRLPGGMPFLAVIGGMAQWLFVRGDVLSVTISAADGVAALEAGEVAARVWRDCAAVLGWPADPVPPARVIKEKRATPAHTPAVDLRHGPPPLSLPGVVLAGDWTCPDLPATIDAAVRSGVRAAEAVLGG